VFPDDLLKILYLFQLQKASRQGLGEAIERRKVIRMAKRTKSECLTMTYDCLLQILHLSSMLEASEHDAPQVIEKKKAIRLTKRAEQMFDDNISPPPPDPPSFSIY
jgi:hypothetical protein